MRIWDVDAAQLCRAHLLGEHRELHAVWTVLTQPKRGYRNHPETRRWEGRLRALFLRHEAQLAEMVRRGYRHASPLDPALATGPAVQDVSIEPLEAQIELLRARDCPCFRKPGRE
jgi:hypothetical protein